MKQPAHWPQEVHYLKSYSYHSSCTQETRSFIEKDTTEPASQVAARRSQLTQSQANVTIRRISDQSHPAFGQFGLFASRKIPAKTRILDYIGEVHCDERPNSYDLSLHRFQSGESVGIDASVAGNEARFINDYRGVKNKPNAAFIEYRTESGELRIGIWSSNEPVQKNEEILVSYGDACLPSDSDKIIDYYYSRKARHGGVLGPRRTVEDSEC